jgi:ABC-2 type transport system permease protein
MHSAIRYLRLLGSFARFSLLGEMAFRGNYLLKVAVEVLWLILMLVFYETIFRQTNSVAGWTEGQYLFFLGCYFALEGVMETFFLGNCSEFAELIRSGDLDLVLLQPIDEQFLISFRNVEWSTVPNVLMGVGLMGYSLHGLGWSVDAVRVTAFAVTFGCAVAMTYSFLMMLASTSVWMIKNQSLFELWWLFTSLMRYPREIYRGPWGLPVGWFFTWVVPVLVVVNVPANAMVKALEPAMVGYVLVVTAVLVWLSRAFFRRALRSYRSASS